jgi:hypothetical protein
MTGDDPNAIIVVDDATEPATPEKLDEHWCEHPGCKRWGCFGFQRGYNISWYCGDHREDGDLIIPRPFA